CARDVGGTYYYLNHFDVW
nr:immunoglobulin heavy chain junction region [Macaca mulatta]MOV39441.1 immunoglobulin heavy chain junction region [Macaca mulatta]MOV41561.1 immunoglobulin heavy chain junction region [Macaca mulatta]